MKNPFKYGDEKLHSFKVKSEHYPEFESQVVHTVCSTYALAKEIEWSTRKFVLDMIEGGEEGIGTMIHIDHNSPAFEGEEVIIQARFESLKANELICSFRAHAGKRLVATGETGQRIFKKKKLHEIFSDFLK